MKLFFAPVMLFWHGGLGVGGLLPELCLNPFSENSSDPPKWAKFPLGDKDLQADF